MMSFHMKRTKLRVGSKVQSLCIGPDFWVSVLPQVYIQFSSVSGQTKRTVLRANSDDRNLPKASINPKNFNIP